MKILSPLSSEREIERLIKAGVDEIYCGVIDEELNSKYKIPNINRRPYSTANMRSFNQLKEVIEKSHDAGIPIYITMNETVYTDKQYDFMEANLEKFCEYKADAVIVADAGMLQLIKDKGYDINVHMSTCASAYNYETVNFYKDMGASRIILPRHMTVNEINELKAKNPELEYEILILNTNCQYDDGYCTYDHSLGNYCNKKVGFHGGGCGAIQNIKTYYKKDDFKNGKVPNIAAQYGRHQRSLGNTCGACYLGQLNLSEIDALKIVGREYIIERKEKDIKFLSKVRDLVNSTSDQEFIRKAVKRYFKEIYNRDCMERCYY